MISLFQSLLIELDEVKIQSKILDPGLLSSDRHIQNHPIGDPSFTMDELPGYCLKQHRNLKNRNLSLISKLSLKKDAVNEAVNEP